MVASPIGDAAHMHDARGVIAHLSEPIAILVSRAAEGEHRGGEEE